MRNQLGRYFKIGESAPESESKEIRAEQKDEQERGEVRSFSEMGGSLFSNSFRVINPL